MQANTENKMGVMPVGPLLFQVSAPIAVSMLIQALYNIVDSFFVAKVSEEALTAVSLAFPVQNLMVSVAVGTGVGVNALLSKSLGEKRYALANETATQAVFLYLLSFLVTFVLGFFGSEAYFQVQTDLPAILAQGTLYTKICTMCSIGVYLQILAERLLQSTGKTIYSMICQGSGAIINVILDPIFIFGLFGLPAMGVAGAALATVIGQITASIVGFTLHHRYNHEVRLSFRSFRPDGSIIRRIYAVGVPSILMRSLSSVTVFGMNAIMMTFSSTATAVLGIYYKLESFVVMPIFGLNNGLVPILAYNYGARKKDRLLHAIRLSLVTAFVISLVGFGLLQLFPSQILSLFASSPESAQRMLSIGVPALRIISIYFLLAGFSIVFSGVFQAFGRGGYSLLVSLFRQILVLLPVAWLLSQSGQLNIIWFAFPIAEVVSILTCLVFMKRIRANQIEPLTPIEEP